MGYQRALPDYTVGAVTVTSGSVIVSGVGTLWQDGLGEYQIAHGDMLCIGQQRPIIIDTVDSATQLTLVEPWPHATAGGKAYRVWRYLPATSSQVLAAINQVLPLLGNGWVTYPKLSTGAPYWDAAGNVGIGTTAPKQKLEVNGFVLSPRYYVDANSYFSADVAGFPGIGFDPNVFMRYNRTAQTYQFYFPTGMPAFISQLGYHVDADCSFSGNVSGQPGINFSPNSFFRFDRVAKAHQFFVASGATSEINAVGFKGNGSQITSPSDPRAKDDIQQIAAPDAEATVMSVKPISFLWRNPSDIGPKFYKGRRRGFLTTDLQPRIPEMVVGEAGAVDDDGQPIMQEMHLDQSPLIAELWAHVQALTERIRALEAKP